MDTRKPVLVDLNQVAEGRSLVMEFLDELRWAKTIAEVNVAAGCLFEALQHTQAVIEVLN